MIVGVTLADKLEREKEHTKQKAILGYDLEKWVHTETNIRDEEHYEIDYVDLKIIPPLLLTFFGLVNPHGLCAPRFLG